MKLSISVVSVLAIQIFIGCSQNVMNRTGGASETINASVIIDDSLVTIKTVAAETVESEIFLVKENHKPLESDSIQSAIIFSNTDAVTFSVDSGSYNIFILRKDDNQSCSFFQVPVFLGSKDTLVDTLSVSGSVNGSVTITQAKSVVVYLKGTPFYRNLTNDYTFKFTHVPRGSYTIVAEVINEENIKTIELRSLNREILIENGNNITDLTLIFSN